MPRCVQKHMHAATSHALSSLRPPFHRQPKQTKRDHRVRTFCAHRMTVSAKRCKFQRSMLHSQKKKKKKSVNCLQYFKRCILLLSLKHEMLLESKHRLNLKPNIRQNLTPSMRANLTIPKLCLNDTQEKNHQPGVGLEPAVAQTDQLHFLLL